MMSVISDPLLGSVALAEVGDEASRPDDFHQMLGKGFGFEKISLGDVFDFTGDGVRAKEIARRDGARFGTNENRKADADRISEKGPRE